MDKLLVLTSIQDTYLGITNFCPPIWLKHQFQLHIYKVWRGNIFPYPFAIACNDGGL